MHGVLAGVTIAALAGAGGQYESPPNVWTGASAAETATSILAQSGDPVRGRPDVTRRPTPPPATPPSGSGIQGRAVMWPSCPAESGDARCAPRPLVARIIVHGGSGQRVAAASTDLEGRFQIALLPGAYTVEARVDGMLCIPVHVTVTDDRHLEVEVRCDTGVR